MSSKAIVKEKVAEWLNSLPIKDYIKEWEIIHESVLAPIKGGIELTKWDMKLLTRMVDGNNTTVYIVVGVRVR